VLFRSEPGPGGPPYRALPLTPDEDRLWAQLNDARTLGAAAARAGVDPDRARAFAARLTRPSVQALGLLDAPPGPRDRAARRLWGPPRPASPRTADHGDGFGGTDLRRWHEEQISDAATHFDQRETTVAHCFARPSPMLGGLPYGAALLDALRARGLDPAGRRVVEVGPGTGQLCRDLLDHLRRLGAPPPADWLRLDLSPVLLAAQAARCPETRGRQADATRLDLPPGSVDLLLCNEVLADLPATRWAPGGGGPVDERLRAAGLRPLPGDGPYNLGAWQLLEGTARALAPGGAAFFTEFGGEDEQPEEAARLDHPEVSIHFGHLAALAAHLGLDAELLPLAELLGADLHARWLGRPGYAALRALHAAAGGALEARAWTAADAPRPEPVDGLRDVPVTEDGPGPVITRFPALILRRPAGGSPPPARADRPPPARGRRRAGG
jgi:SAM-dependent methyltransferase